MNIGFQCHTALLDKTLRSKVRIFFSDSSSTVLNPDAYFNGKNGIELFYKLVLVFLTVNSFKNS